MSDPLNLNYRRFINWNSGAIAGILSAVILQPFDVLKTYTIVVNKSESSLRKGCSFALSKYGVKGLWRGVTPAIYRAMLGSGSFFLILEELKYIFSVSSFWALGLCSGAAKVSITILCMPISIIKVRMESPTCSAYKNFKHAFQTMYKNEGISGFYRGLTPTLIREVPYSSLGYGFYEKYIQVIGELLESDRSNVKVTFLAGSMAGCSATMITQPFDVLKTKIQYSKISGGSYGGMIESCRTIYREDGLLGFQRGLTARICRRVCSFPLVWTLYEQIGLKGLSKE